MYTEKITQRTNHFHDNSSFVELFNDAFPVDNAWIYDVIQLEQYLSIGKVAVQAIHSRRYTHAVHPVTICCQVQITNWFLITKNASHTRYQALGPELIPVYRQSSPAGISHPPGGRLPLLSARPAITFPAAEHHRLLAGTKLYCLVTETHRCEQLAQGCYTAFASRKICTHDLLITSPTLRQGATLCQMLPDVFQVFH